MKGWRMKPLSRRELRRMAFHRAKGAARELALLCEEQFGVISIGLEADASMVKKLVLSLRLQRGVETDVSIPGRVNGFMVRVRRVGGSYASIPRSGI